MPIFADMSRPYGELRESVVRVVSWNVWCHFGPWEDRFRAIGNELRSVDADLVAVLESWHAPGLDPIGDIADDLGYRVARAENWYEPFEIDSGSVLLSRWPIVAAHDRRTPGQSGQPGALLQHARVDGLRGELDVFLVMLDWRPGRSDIRQRQVRELGDFILEHNDHQRPAIVCGDFNAPPDSDEMRSLTGEAAATTPGLIFYDAWALAGDGSSGNTWSNRNPWAAPALLPDRRIDYVLSAWPRAHGVGHPVSCRVIGDTFSDGYPPSDHYGLAAELRY